MAEDLELKYGIPIVNKRISITPASFLTQNFSGKEIVLAKALDKASKEVGVDFLGGWTALVHKSMTAADRSFLESIPEVLASTDRLCSSVNVGSTRAGINMDAVKLMGEVVKKPLISRGKATATVAQNWWRSAMRLRTIRLWRAHFTERAKATP